MLDPVQMTTDPVTNTTAPVSPLLTAEQAGGYLKLNPRTLANWRVLGRGPKYVRVGRRPYYRLPDLEVWLAEHHFAHTAAERAAKG